MEGLTGNFGILRRGLGGLRGLNNRLGQGYGLSGGRRMIGGLGGKGYNRFLKREGKSLEDEEATKKRIDFAHCKEIQILSFLLIRKF